MTETLAPTIHIYGPTASNSARVRALCPDPGHRRLAYGLFTLYYDGWRLSLDCGSYYDGEGGYFGHRGPQGGRGRRRQLPRKVWNQWPVRCWLRKVKDRW